jgi:D-alanyl-lipoteichoic acid acyltransferase DltB (MBOAT superfamily)
MVSYLVDVYRGTKTPEKHLGFFALYTAFFPKLLAGPIERAKQLLDQFHDRPRVDWNLATNGFKLMTWGLFKKVVIADRLASFVDIVYNDPTKYEGITLTMVVIFYSFQIYCDFSGYCDIAIGISQVFGYRLADNFNRPYTARSVAEFWRRWHISLSTWLRDYLYIPLGGNRVIPARLYVNLMLVFLICGLWHGPNWTFVEWGLIHGLYLVFGLASRSLRARLTHAVGLDRMPTIHRWFQILVTFILVSLAWIFFRADSLNDGIYIISHLHTGWQKVFNWNALGPVILISKQKTDLILAVCGILSLGLMHAVEKHENMRMMFGEKPLWLRWTFYYAMATGVLLLSAPSSQKFIYFQF